MGKPTFDPSTLTANDIHIDNRADIPNTPEGESFVQNVKNSAKAFGSNLYNAVTSPLQTATSIHDVVNGYLNKIPGVHADTPEDKARQDQMANAMTKHFKDRYGSIDNIKKTAYTDPVGFVADVSSIVAPLAGGAGALGEAADAAGLARTASALRTAAKVGTTVSEATNPMNVGKGAAKATQLAGGALSGARADIGSAVTRAGEALEHPITGGGTALARKLYAQTLKPSGATAAERTAKVNTLLKEGIGPAAEQPAWDKINQYANQVEQMFNDPRAQGVMANPQNVVDAMDPLLAPTGKESWEAQLAPMGEPAKVDAVRQNFIDKHFNPGTPATPPTPSGVLDPQGNMIMHPGTPAVPASPRPIDLPSLQEEKANTYSRLKDSAFGGGGVAAPIDVPEQQGRVALARGARQEIGNRLADVGITGIHEINAREGGLLDAMPDLQRNAAKLVGAGVFGTAKEALVRQLLPQAAIRMYQAGRLPWETTEHILKQGAVAGAQSQQQ